MDLRSIKARHDTRTSHRIARHPYNDEWDNDYGDDDWGDDLSCTWCGGEGYAEVDDPLWDECDEFGYGPCKSCRGTGSRKDQWVF